VTLITGRGKKEEKELIETQKGGGKRRSRGRRGRSKN